MSSGAIALGLKGLKFDERPEDLPSLQAAAACGRSRLMNRWPQDSLGHGRFVVKLD